MRIARAFTANLVLLIKGNPMPRDQRSALYGAKHADANAAQRSNVNLPGVYGFLRKAAEHSLFRSIFVVDIVL